MKMRRHNGVVRPEYWVWRDIKQRCLNPKSTAYRNYGARGIRVHPDWMTFEGFFSDMGNRPTPRHTIERVDNDGDYTPGNCRWILKSKQADNRRNVQRVTFRGETHATAEWCRILGLNYRTVQQRIGKLHWDGVRALTTPTIRRKGV